jgi:signal transduction histidine kinase
MTKHIAWIVTLMAMSVIGVTGLQLFWNYRNYQNVVAGFDHDTNEALRVAVDREIDHRNQVIVQQVMRWMNDTSFITITCDTNNRGHNTVFHVNDTHPYDPHAKSLSMSLSDFKEHITTLTPEAKAIFIRHFGTRLVYEDLKKGTVYYYTQRLGDSIEHIFSQSTADTSLLKDLLEEELHTRNINTPFTLKPGGQSYRTLPVNTALRRPYEKEMVTAGFETPGRYFIKNMKWVITGTFLLISITLFCFAYTTRTLLSQHKLSVLKSNFINNMTHELNTPLASIKITADALKTFAHEPKRLDEYLGIIGFQAEKLTGLADRILHANQWIDRTSKDWVTFDFDTLIKEAILGQHITYISNSLFIRGDRQSLWNALANIIDNALKYNDQPQPEIHISLQREGNMAVIRIIDNGPGIPTEYREQIFEPFFRVPQGNRHDVKGYGLGLSFAKQVVVAHHGNISVRNNEGQGCMFIIKIPTG